MSNCDCEECQKRRSKTMHQSDSAVDKIVALALEFHIKTGADMELIKQFIRDVGEVHTMVALNVMKEEILGKD